MSPTSFFLSASRSPAGARPGGVPLAAGQPFSLSGVPLTRPDVRLPNEQQASEGNPDRPWGLSPTGGVNVHNMGYRSPEPCNHA